MKKVILIGLTIMVFCLSGCVNGETFVKQGIVYKIKEWDVGFTYSDIEYELFFIDNTILWVRLFGDMNINNIRLNQTGIYKYKKDEYEGEKFNVLIGVEYIN